MDIIDMEQMLLNQNEMETVLRDFEMQKIIDEGSENILSRYLDGETDEECVIRISELTANPPPLMGLSVKQPWAAAIAAGEQTSEYRTWDPGFWGTIVICSSAKPDSDIYEDEYKDIDNIDVNGSTICLVDIVRVQTIDEFLLEEGADMDDDDAWSAWGGYTHRWVLANPRSIEHRPVKGQVRLFEVDRNDVIIVGGKDE